MSNTAGPRLGDHPDALFFGEKSRSGENAIYRPKPREGPLISILEFEDFNHDKALRLRDNFEHLQDLVEYVEEFDKAYWSKGWWREPAARHYDLIEQAIKRIRDSCPNLWGIIEGCPKTWVDILSWTARHLKFGRGDWKETYLSAGEANAGQRGAHLELEDRVRHDRKGMFKEGSLIGHLYAVWGGDTAEWRRKVNRDLSTFKKSIDREE